MEKEGRWSDAPPNRSQIPLIVLYVANLRRTPLRVPLWKRKLTATFVIAAPNSQTRRKTKTAVAANLAHRAWRSCAVEGRQYEGLRGWKEAGKKGTESKGKRHTRIARLARND